MRSIKLSLLLLSILSWPAFGQGTEQVMTSFIHVDSEVLTDYKIIAFQLSTHENAPMAWKSDLIKPLYKDSAARYMMKVDIPKKILAQQDMLECTAITKKSYGIFNWMYPKDKRTVEIPYGGVSFSVIQLEIKSNPQGAEVYLVPMRIWEKRFKGKPIARNLEDMEFYKVNTSVTDTLVRIDQTVFKIVFHAAGQFKTITHRPKPESIAPQQSVSVQF